MALTCYGSRKWQPSQAYAAVLLAALLTQLWAAFCLKQVALFYGLTQPYEELQQHVQLPGSRDKTAAPAAAALQQLLTTQQLSAAAAAAGPQLSCKGKFSGRVLVVPASNWHPADALQDFASAAAAAGVHWHASCKRGRLKLVAVEEPVHEAAQAAAHVKRPAAGSTAAEQSATTAKVGRTLLLLGQANCEAC
jgi:hypothetical protein